MERKNDWSWLRLEEGREQKSESEEDIKKK